jgi:hypothetical protein
MKGRTPSAEEKRFHSLLCQHVGCIPCRIDQKALDLAPQQSDWVSVHHIDGRTKPHAHWYVIPLCAGHHQQGYGVDKTMQSVHGNKYRFEQKYGAQMDLLRQAIRELVEQGCNVPEPALSIL